MKITVEFTEEEFKRFLRWQECDDSQNKFSGQSVDILGLTVREENILRNEGIHTIEALLEIGKYRIVRVPNCGRKMVKDLTEKLAAKGFNW